ncbi:DsbA family protein [Ornithinimicrobium cryptoxanthini]|uniref:Thioredoxin domain-containing protein n=1 Tax=Ornithinimicrobium cryptoxanthini TaxID=2934161 RepID=A0ABY4YIF0_9MICO|nr:thioredoxin domain-containing protein [Ornithinimicrobium cryptoxanthini]USQ76539.1 thioredoxin domain-containing protein [Ornithinimicrobium cryptoxanthini]
MSTPSGQVPPGDEHPAAPIAPSPYASYPPSGPRKQTASIMWAIATIVVALVGGFLIYTAMTQDDTETAGPESGQESGQDATPGSTGTAPATEGEGVPAVPSADAPQAETAAPTGETAAPTVREMSEEQKQFLLGLARRDADDPMAMGEVDAPVVVIEYADYRCPFCAEWGREVQPELRDLVEDGTLRIEFRDRVIFGAESELVAMAARAAGEQGLYWQFHDAVYAAAPDSGHPDLPREMLIGFAEEIGVPDLAQFEEDLDSAELREGIAADQAEATSLGINSTPTFLVNSTPVQGAQPAEVFRQIIALELEAATG